MLGFNKINIDLYNSSLSWILKKNKYLDKRLFVSVTTVKICYQKELPPARPSELKSKLHLFSDVYVLPSLWMAIFDTAFHYLKLFINDTQCKYNNFLLPSNTCISSKLNYINILGLLFTLKEFGRKMLELAKMTIFSNSILIFMHIS